MPNAAEMFIEIADQLDVPAFCMELCEEVPYLEGCAEFSGNHSCKSKFSIKFYGESIIAGNSEDLRGLLETVQNNEVGDDIRNNAAGCIRILLAFQEINWLICKKEEYADIVHSLINCLDNNNPSIRKAAIYALGGSKDLLAVSSLTKMFHDKGEDRKIRVLAAESLGEIGDHSAIEPLSEIICNDSDIGVKFAALIVLNSIDSSKAIQLSHEVYSSDDVLLKLSAAYVLAENGNQKALQFLKSFLNHSDLNFRRWITYALAQLKDLSVVDILIGMLMRSENVEQDKNSEEYHKILRFLSHFFESYPVETTNALIDALNKGKISIGVVKEIIEKTDTVRNPDAYLQFHLNKNDKRFSCISSLPSDDIDKISDCCKTILKVGFEAIAILNEHNQKESIHALYCPSVKAAYWS